MRIRKQPSPLLFVGNLTKSKKTCKVLFFAFFEKFDLTEIVHNIIKSNIISAMLNIIADLHTHTLASGHAYGTIREMAKAASNKGLLAYGHSDHAPGIPGTCHPFYFACFDEIPKYLYGVRILGSCEVNILDDGSLSLEDRFISSLDYAIAGIHLNCYTDHGKKVNTQNVIKCMKNEKVKLISHPDSDKMSLDYESLTDAALDYNVALEVNNSSLKNPSSRPNCIENYKKMLKLSEKKGVRIIVSSDAHDPSSVGSFDKAVKLLDDLSFDQSLVVNSSFETLMSFLSLPF